MYGALFGAPLTAQTVVHGVKMVADVAHVSHRANDSDTVGQRSQARVQLAEPQAGDGGGNGPVRAADTVGRFGLQIPGVEVAGSAAQPEEDTRLLGRPVAQWAIGVHLGGDHTWQAHAQGTDAAG